MVEKIGNKKTAGWHGARRCDEQTHRYLLQSERPVLSHYGWNRHVHNYGQVTYVVLKNNKKQVWLVTARLKLEGTKGRLENVRV